MLQLHEAAEKGKRAVMPPYLRYDAVARGCGKGKTCCRVAIPTRCCGSTRPRKRENVLSRRVPTYSCSSTRLRKKENVLTCHSTYFMVQSHEAAEKGKRAVVSLYLLDVAVARGRGKGKTCWHVGVPTYSCSSTRLGKKENVLSCRYTY
jgi:hypothetical protein